ncbi:MAG: D-3-phosphoglycerate dehydrogenase [Gammaproteobacteria bacterium]|nr:MAG: D-3-phosphoglycerate dehydrogenase [Gammaproteobacteria bacterium]
MDAPDAIVLRSFKMHDMPIPDSLKAVGRAGAGVNNIPVERLSARGIPVFNTPGANANAVKELVIAGMLLAARNLCQAWRYVLELDAADDETLNKQVEDGKKRFAGIELPGRTLGVVGLGAIGVLVANAARALGMRVIGYDPHITVESAWRLSSDIVQAGGLDEVLREADFLTVHVPLNDQTRHMIDAARLDKMKDGVVLLNFARAGILDDAAVLAALERGKAAAYVTDFPSLTLRGHPRVIALPHLGASTREAEENCAVMVVDQIRDFLENGNIRNSVNFPAVSLPRAGVQRLAVANANRPDMVAQISHVLGSSDVNIVHMVNESRGQLAYTLIDVDSPVSPELVERIRGIEGVLSLRLL